MQENSALAAALSAMGDTERYNCTLSVAEQADQRLRELAPPPSYDTEIARILDAGELPADFTAWARTQIDAEAVHETEKRALTALRDQAAGECWNTFSVYTPEILHNLHAQLLACVDQAREAADILAPLPTAEDIVRAGTEAVTAFGVVDALWPTYLTIRQAQGKVMREGVTDEVLVGNCRSRDCLDPDADDSHFSNMDQLWPHWRAGGSPDGYVFLGDRTAVTRKDNSPWPERGPMRLVWLINHGAEFWVPTAAQLEALHKWRHDTRRAIEQTQQPEWKQERGKKRMGAEEIRRVRWQQRSFVSAM
ncbi:hypothetical protein [Nocardia aurea]|uniref:hypothetical protein n=1 Tax=Nocardia aurea TaxID=2144174 RepID=UPI0033BB7509